MSPRTPMPGCLLVLASLAAGCGSSGGGSGPKKLEVFSWFTSGSEAAALTALFDQVTIQHPDIPRLSIKNAAQNEPTNAQDLLDGRMAAGNPPDSFQVVSGSDLSEWIKDDALMPLTEIEREQGWASVVPASVVKSITEPQSHVIYGVPLNIERNNTIFYNKALVPSMPTDVDAILALAAQLQAKGVTPFAVSDTGGWTIASHVFESVLVAQAGADFYTAYLMGQEQPDAPQVQTALATTSRMLAMSNTDDAPVTEWFDAVNKVCTGQAAMLVMPDFVKGEFAIRRCDPGKVGYVPMQKSGESVFIFDSVTFELPRGAPDIDGAREFLQTVGSVQGQVAFNLLKGSLPARSDVDLAKAGFDSISQQTFADLTARTERLVPSYAALTSTTFQSAVNTALQAFADRTSAYYLDVPTVIAELKINYKQINQL